MAEPASGMFSRTFLFPLRLLIYLVRLIAASINVLVYFLFALLLYLVAIPLFVLNAMIQILMYPLRLLNGNTSATDFRTATLLWGPHELFMQKEEALVDWVRGAWTVFEPKHLLRQRLEADKEHIRTQTIKAEIPPPHGPPPVHERREPILPGHTEKQEMPIPVLGEKDQTWRGKAANVWRYVRLECPYCGVLENQSRRGYPVQNDGASVLQFTQDPGSEYTGGEGYGIWTCAACGNTSYMMELSPSRGAYNFWTRQWERRPRLRFKPVKEVPAADISKIQS